MRLLRHPLFLWSAALFALKYLLEHLRIFTWPLVHAYLDDLLALPVILTLVVAVQRQWVYRNPRYILSKFQVIFAVVYVAVLFEGLLPALSASYTRDAWDVVAYAVGAGIFYRFINRPGFLSSRK